MLANGNIDEKIALNFLTQESTSILDGVITSEWIKYISNFKMYRDAIWRINAFLQIKSTMKVTEHSLQVPMLNAPLLLNYSCFGARFCKSQG